VAGRALAREAAWRCHRRGAASNETMELTSEPSDRRSSGHSPGSSSQRCAPPNAPMFFAESGAEATVGDVASVHRRFGVVDGPDLGDLHDRDRTTGPASLRARVASAHSGSGPRPKQRPRPRVGL
jgi:hypothetical protein